MTKEEFEQLVEEGYLEIPAALREKVHNVAIVIEHEPSPQLRRAQGLRPHETLLGLYHGRPHTAREYYGVGMTLPDTITIFQRPIEETAGGDPDRIRAVARDTIWHEIAHYFGLDEPQVRWHEARRRRHPPHSHS